VASSSAAARHRIRFILIGAVLGITWASSLRAFMQQVAGPDSEFTFAGTFGIIIPAGAATGALLGWAEYQRRAGRQHRLLIAAPLLIGVAPLVQPGAIAALLTTGDGLAPLGLALLAMVGGYAVSGRGPRWARIAAGLVALADVLAVWAAPKPFPDLAITTAQGAWFDTLASSLYMCLALAASIPMLRPVSGPGPEPAVAGAAAPVSSGQRKPQPLA
jgi:hypothetical protein